MGKIIYNKISILIVNFNTAKLVNNLVNSIEEHNSGFQYEVIIVDNDSQDEDIRILKNLEQRKNVKVIFSKQNLGFGKANNLAFHHSSGNFIVLLNPDTLLIENSLQKVLNFRLTLNRPAIIGIRLVLEDGSWQKSKLMFPNLTNALSQAFFLDSIFKGSEIFDRVYYGWQSDSETCQVDFVRGAFMFMDREIFEKLNGFDEDYFLYTEEADLCYRAWQLGIPVWYYPETKIIHLESQSMKIDRRFTWIELYRSQILFMKKHHGRFQSFCFRLVLALSAFNRIILNSILAIFKQKRFFYEKSLIYFYSLLWLLGIPLIVKKPE